MSEAVGVQLQSRTNGGNELFVESIALLYAFTAFFSSEVSKSTFAVETNASESWGPFS